MLSLASAFLHIGSAVSAVLTSQLHDLPDAVSGEDLWQVSFTFGGGPFSADQGFTVYFDYATHRNLSAPLAPINAGWDLLVVQPDAGLPDDGFLDGLALTDNPSLVLPFTLTFVWLGSGQPASQRFELYDLEGGFSVIESGTTIVVPETQGLQLAASLGLLAWLCSRRRMPCSRS